MYYTITLILKQKLIKSIIIFHLCSQPVKVQINFSTIFISFNCHVNTLHKCTMSLFMSMHRSVNFQTPPNAVDLLLSCEGL